MNSLPKTVTRQRRGCDLNSGPSAHESSTLTTRLPSHAKYIRQGMYMYVRSMDDVMFAHYRTHCSMSIPMQRMTLLLTPLLRRIYCVVSQTTTGAETRRLHRARVPAWQRSLQCTTELSMDWVDPWVALGRVQERPQNYGYGGSMPSCRLR